MGKYFRSGIANRRKILVGDAFYLSHKELICGNTYDAEEK
jgi:hypothetical protein